MNHKRLQHLYLEAGLPDEFFEVVNERACRVMFPVMINGELRPAKLTLLQRAETPRGNAVISIGCTLLEVKEQDKRATQLFRRLLWRNQECSLARWSAMENTKSDGILVNPSATFVETECDGVQFLNLIGAVAQEWAGFSVQYQAVFEPVAPIGDGGLWLEDPGEAESRLFPIVSQWGREIGLPDVREIERGNVQVLFPVMSEGEIDHVPVTVITGGQTNTGQSVVHLVSSKLEIPADWHLLDRLCFHAMAASMNSTEAKWCGRPKRTDHSTYQFLTVASLFLDTSPTDQFFSAGASLTALHDTMPSLVENVQEEAN